MRLMQLEEGRERWERAGETNLHIGD